MSGLRPWGVMYFRQATGAPFLSLGIHVDLHTPRVDVFLPRSGLTIGRIRWWTDSALDGDRLRFGERLYMAAAHPWNGHSDDCDHPR